MKEKALQYYKQGYNCSQCILKAAEQAYKIPISKQCYQSCSVLSNGYGVGEFCSVLIAGIMIFGLMFNENMAKSLRIKLLSIFREKRGSFNCSQLTKDKDSCKGCENIVYEIAEIIEDIIAKEYVSVP